jgi:hypothetical protein
MPTLRRILKYTPAAATAILVVAWAMSLYTEFWMDIPAVGTGRYISGCESGSWYFGFNNLELRAPGTNAFDFYTHRNESSTSGGLGRFEADRSYHPDGTTLYRWWFDVPILCLLTANLPLTSGFLIAFRFRLWHYLAYTALIAVELAYYLRWQE